MMANAHHTVGIFAITDILMTQQLVTPGSEENQAQYHWSFTGRIMTLDNGSRLIQEKNFKELMSLETFSVVSFDPLNKTAQLDDLSDIDELQIVPNITLGNGQPITRHDCLNEVCSATLPPLPSTLDQTYAIQNNKDSGPNRIVVQPTIPSIALDDINDLERLDWLVLDTLNDNATILKNGNKTLQNTLLIDVHIPFQATHEGQADFTVINYFLNDLGFRFFRFQNLSYSTDLPRHTYLEKTKYSDTLSATALFIPTEERLKNLPINQLSKLGFLLHTVYRCKDTAYKILSLIDEALAHDYLVAEGFLWPVNEEETEFTLTESYSPDIWASKPVI